MCSQWLPILAVREPGDKKRRKKSTLTDWLIMLQRRGPGKKQRRKKSTLGGYMDINVLYVKRKLSCCGGAFA